MPVKSHKSLIFKSIKMGYYFTSESVSEGHPDKVADQISDALLDEFLRSDPNAKVACETLVTTGLVVCAGEVQTNGYVDIQSLVRKTLKDIGYTRSEYQFEANSCGIISAIHEQSADIRQGVVREKLEDQGAGDQGMMFGYATREQDNLMPLPIEIAHDLLYTLAKIRKEHLHLMPYLRPDAKSQVTIKYDDNGKPSIIDTIVISTQHDEFVLPKDTSPEAIEKAQKAMQDKISEDIKRILIPQVINEYRSRGNQQVADLFNDDIKYLINPTGKFVIGGPHGDSGLTGRKIIVDTYGGKGAHGGGAFSGKDPSKVDRSAAYAARHIAKNMVAAGIADEILVQIAYAIGVAKPVGIYVNTFGTCNIKSGTGAVLSDGDLAQKIDPIFDLRPYAINQRFGLKNPIYLETAKYGHFGRDPKDVEVEVYYENGDTFRKNVNGTEKIFKKVTLFPWEKIDYVDTLKKEFSL